MVICLVEEITVSVRKPPKPKFRKTRLIQRFDKVNLVQFSGMVCGGVGWRTFPLGRNNSNLSLALCVFRERFLKINSILDDKRVPLWYLDFVLYHEMLHLHMGPRQFDCDKYAYPHDDRFKCLEVRHPDFSRAEKFEKQKLDRIINSHRRWREWEKIEAKNKRLAAKKKKRLVK